MLSHVFRLLFRFFRQHLFYGVAIVLSLLCALLLLLCIVFLPHKPVEYPSPSGKYRISASVDRNTSRVKLFLKDPKGQPVSSLRTRASDFMKWALGWMPDTDTIVLYSSDAGTLAYTIAPTGKITATKITPAIDQRARELKKAKYQ
ncbi:hypothetical protein BH09VER1_BH09VER1_43860 [soil metagenome]